MDVPEPADALLELGFEEEGHFAMASVSFGDGGRKRADPLLAVVRPGTKTPYACLLGDTCLAADVTNGEKRRCRFEVASKRGLERLCAVGERAQFPARVPQRIPARRGNTRNGRLGCPVGMKKDDIDVGERTELALRRSRERGQRPARRKVFVGEGGEGRLRQRGQRRTLRQRGRVRVVDDREPGGDTGLAAHVRSRRFRVRLFVCG